MIINSQFLRMVMPEYTCPLCHIVFPKLKNIKRHYVEQKCQYPYTCKECSVPFFTRNAAIIHHANTNHATGYDAQQLRNINSVLKDMSPQTGESSHETSRDAKSESSEAPRPQSVPPSKSELLTIVIDGRNLFYKCQGFGGVHLLLDQLLDFVGKIPGQSQIIAVVPSFWYFKRGTTLPTELKNLLGGSKIRTVQMQISQNDKEMDDVVAFSLAQAFNGYLISGDKNIPSQVGFDNNSWNEQKLLRVKNTFDKGFDLLLPNKVDPGFQKYYALGWPSCYKVENIQPWHWDEFLSFSNKQSDIESVFFCPHCGDDFVSFSELTTHLVQTKHGVIVCQCGDEFHSLAKLTTHFSTTNHLSAEGRIFSFRNCIRTLIESSEEE
jgi:hypothetical protein